MLAEFITRLYRDVVTRQFGPWDEKLQDKFFLKTWEAHPHQIIQCDGEDCGYLSIERYENEIMPLELVLDPKFQSKGIGTKIIEDIKKESSQSGIPVRFQALKQNKKAIDLYMRLGFEQVGQTEAHFQFEWNQS